MGLLDTYGSAHAAWFLAKVRDAYSGPCIVASKEVSGTKETTDIGFDVDGYVDESALLSFASDADNGDVKIEQWYDQSGNGNHFSNDDFAQQSYIVRGGEIAARAPGGYPAAQHDDSADGYWDNMNFMPGGVDGVNAMAYYQFRDFNFTTARVLSLVGAEGDTFLRLEHQRDSGDDFLYVRVRRDPVTDTELEHQLPQTNQWQVVGANGRFTDGEGDVDRNGQIVHTATLDSSGTVTDDAGGRNQFFIQAVHVNYIGCIYWLTDFTAQEIQDRYDDVVDMYGLAVPAQVTGLEEDQVTEDSTSFTWDELPGADHYEVRRDGVTIDSNVTEESFSDTGLDPDTTYTYEVRGVNSEGNGEWSESLAITTSEEASGLGTLSGVVTQQSDGSAVEGAKVYVINSDTDTLEAVLTTDSNGAYSVQVTPGTYHVATQYQDGDGMMNSESLPFITVQEDA